MERCRSRMAAALLAAATISLGAQAPSDGVQRLAWLQGCWETAAAADRTVEEQWTAPRGGSMLGTSRTVRGGATAWIEGTRNGQARRIEFPYHRTACAGN